MLKKVTELLRRTNTLPQKCIWTIVVLLLCRACCSIPTPGVNPEYFQTILGENATLNFLNALTGSGLSNLSIMTLSITPYITASIIMQLLGVAFPKIHEMTKGMEDDRKLIEKVTIAVGAGVAFFEALAMSVSFGRQGMLVDYKWYWIILVSILWTLGATALSAVGKFMSDKKNLFIGNGVSLILLVNILSSYPQDAARLGTVFFTGKDLPAQLLAAVIIVVLVYAMFSFTYLIQKTEKRIKVNYTKKLKTGGQNRQVSVIPFKICPGGVVPIIFASTLMTFPVLIAELLGKSDGPVLQILNSSSWFNTAKPIYTIGVLIYVFLIFGFSYYYTDITMNPAEVAENLRKHGGMINGIRPGKPTADYLERQTKVTIAIGAAGLSVIAIIPAIVGGLFGVRSLAFLGTSILITVSVIVETWNQIKSQNMAKSYHKQGGLFT